MIAVNNDSIPPDLFYEAALVLIEQQPDPDQRAELRERFEHRAAIAEYDGGRVRRRVESTGSGANGVPGTAAVVGVGGVKLRRNNSSAWTQRPVGRWGARRASGTYDACLAAVRRVVGELGASGANVVPTRRRRGGASETNDPSSRIEWHLSIRWNVPICIVE